MIKNHKPREFKKYGCQLFCDGERITVWSMPSMFNEKEARDVAAWFSKSANYIQINRIKNKAKARAKDATARTRI